MYFLCDIMHDAMLYLFIDCIYKCKFSVHFLMVKGDIKKKVLAVSLKRNFLVSDFFCSLSFCGSEVTLLRDFLMSMCTISVIISLFLI